MIDRHINWARCHDWFIREINGAVIVRDGDRLKRFDNFPALYKWAGYQETKL